jgi:outer membrane receptor for ferrienterochelin and colicin
MNYLRALPTLVIGLIGLAGSAIAAESEIEEVIVTGSYIKGLPGDAPSPVQTLSRDDIVLSGVSDTAEMVRNLEIASGSDTTPGQVWPTSICAVSGQRRPWC